MYRIVDYRFINEDKLYKVYLINCFPNGRLVPHKHRVSLVRYLPIPPQPGDIINLPPTMEHKNPDNYKF